MANRFIAYALIFILMGLVLFVESVPLFGWVVCYGWLSAWTWWVEKYGRTQLNRKSLK